MGKKYKKLLKRVEALERLQKQGLERLSAVTLDRLREVEAGPADDFSDRMRGAGFLSAEFDYEYDTHEDMGSDEYKYDDYTIFVDVGPVTFGAVLRKYTTGDWHYSEEWVQKEI